MDIRNIAIIAHVDHGKTTLVDALLKAGGAFSAHEQVQERVMDSDAQERERGITIYAKNASCDYKGVKINIVDTPGHADFGSEVERVLRTVDAALLLVDAAEGPMPQTRFVLQKALAIGLKVCVILNKIDKQQARPDEVLDETFDLFSELGASDFQLDFPYIYTIAREGLAMAKLDDPRVDIAPLFDFILEQVPPAPVHLDRAFRMQPATLAYDNYVGRLAVGRVLEGSIKTNQQVTIIGQDGQRRPGKMGRVYTFKGMQRTETDHVESGDIVAISGLPDIYVGETIASDSDAEPMPSIRVDPPTLAMTFLVNNSAFAGREGKFVTSRHIKARLEREAEHNVGLRIESEADGDSFKVSGRGEMHLAVLLENMRREGYELQVTPPEVLVNKGENGVEEPIENAVVVVPEESAGKVIEALGIRKGLIQAMETVEGRTTLNMEIPTRGLLGFRNHFLILTKGEGVLYHTFSHYGPHRGEIRRRQVGSMISGVTGTAIAYSLNKLQERGPLFIEAGVEVYEGMIIGEHNQGTDIVVNPIKEKQLTNIRASGSDDAVKLTPPITMTLEAALQYIQADEMVEITPKNLRIRKRLLTENERRRYSKN